MNERNTLTQYTAFEIQQKKNIAQYQYNVVKSLNNVTINATKGDVISTVKQPTEHFWQSVIEMCCVQCLLNCNKQHLKDT